jgi:chromosome segregation ATPase
MEEEVKVAVLETRLENFETLVTRLDSAIEKIAEVNNNVSRMLAVHEQRISKQEEIDEILFDKIDKLRDKMDSDHDSVSQRLSLLERKLWIGIGALGAILVATNPQAIKTLRPLLSSSESAIIQPVNAAMNESHRF